MQYQFYILDENKKVVECNDAHKWSQWMNSANRIVEQTQISSDVRVSTVFIGIGGGFAETFPSFLFETMIFGGARDMFVYHYWTWDEAVKGHKEVVASFQGRCLYCDTLRINDEVKCKSCGGNF